MLTCLKALAIVTAAIAFLTWVCVADHSPCDRGVV